jgi:hypothetical protein
MTMLRTAKQLVKRANRRADNAIAKELRAHNRHTDLITLGETVLVTEKDGVKSYDFAPFSKVIEPLPSPRLSWLGGKQYAQQGDSRKNRSHHGMEHREGFEENASRMFASAITEALKPSSILPATVPAPDLGEITKSI